MDKTKKKILKIDKKLPQIILPENKIQMMVDWWNEDIRFEKSIPHSFESGYLILNNSYNHITENPDYRKTISKIAHEMQTTFSYIKNQLELLIGELKTLTIYFIFTDNNSMYLEIYGANGDIISTATFTVGESSDIEKKIDLKEIKFDNVDGLLNNLNYTNMAIIITCLWYIATTNRKTKYIYENKTPVILGRKKGVVQVSDTKFITTPIYNFNKVKVVKVESLKSRKQGWTYSHSFQVHGHFRHYKNGKTIFIQPFIKGKNKKEFKSQKIILNPEQ